MWVEDWTPRAACRAAQPDQLFVRGAEQNKAKQVCQGCPVRTECLAEALDNQIHILRRGQLGLIEQIAALEAGFSSELGSVQSQLGLLQTQLGALQATCAGDSG